MKDLPAIIFTITFVVFTLTLVIGISLGGP